MPLPGDAEVKPFEKRGGAGKCYQVCLRTALEGLREQNR